VRHEQEIASLRSEISYLEEQLLLVTMERDEALTALEVARLRRNTGPLEPELLKKPDPACPYCHGEGIIWVHDFRVECKRCSSPRQAEPC
jgi:hypothetical protein